MNKHTPGPWRFVAFTDNGTCDVPVTYTGPGFYENPYIISDNGENIIGCDEYNVFLGENRAANIRLMTAAPDLLGALKECAERLAIHMQHTEDLVAHMKAIAAIAKATGEQP